MTLSYSRLEFAFGKGQDEGTHPFKLQAPLLQSLVNGRVLKDGSIEKRNGWAQGPVATGRPRVLSDGAGTLFQLSGEYGNLPSPFTPRPPIEVSILNSQDSRLDSIGGNINAQYYGSRSLSEVEVIDRQSIWRDNDLRTNTFPDLTIDKTTGLECIVWEGKNGPLRVILACVIDSATRQVVLATQPISDLTKTTDARHPRVVYHNAKFYVVWEHCPSAGTSDGQLYLTSFDLATLTWDASPTAPAAFNNYSMGSGVFDVSESDGNENNSWWLAYTINSSNNIEVAKIFGFTPTTFVLTAVAGFCINIYASATNNSVWVSWYEVTGGSKGIRAAARSWAAPGTVILAPSPVHAEAGTGDFPVQVASIPVDLTTQLFIWTMKGNDTVVTNYARQTSKFVTMNTGATLGAPSQKSSLELISKPVLGPNGRIYAAFLCDASGEEFFFGSTIAGGTDQLRSIGYATAYTVSVTSLVEASNGTPATSWRPVATWAIGSAGQARRDPILNSQVGSLSGFKPNPFGTEFDFALSSEFAETTDLSLHLFGKKGVDVCRNHIEPENWVPVTAAKLGPNIMFSGGVPKVWDGQNLAEYGFLTQPENAVLTRFTSGTGHLTANGTYAAQIIYEYRLATGDVVQSAPIVCRQPTPSLANIVLIGSNDSISISVPGLSLTGKFNDSLNASGVMGAIVKTYITQSLGSVFNYAGAVDQANSDGYALNDPMAAGLANKLVIICSQPDTTTITNETLYTAGGVLANYPPPALAQVITHANRFFGIKAEDRTTIAFSNTYEPGELPGFHPFLELQVPEPVVALASLDSMLVIICASAVYTLGGTGPDRTGGNSDFTAIQKLNSPHGCASAASVVSVPEGIIWQAATNQGRGTPSTESFVMLQRTLVITRIGGPVEDTLGANPFVVSAVVMADKERVYWACSSDPLPYQAASGAVIVYDWRNNVWSVDTIAPPSGGGACLITSLATRGNDVFATVAGGTGGPNPDTRADLRIYKHGGYNDPGSSFITTTARTGWLNFGQIQGFARAREIALLGENQFFHGVSVRVSQDYGLSSDVFTMSDTDIQALNSYEHVKFHIAHQRCSALQVEISDTLPVNIAPNPPYGPSAKWVGFVIEAGVKARIAKLPQTAMR